MTESHNQSEFKMQLNVKQVFWAGFVVGALAAFALGFILSFARGGSMMGGIFSGSLDRNAPAAPAAPSAPSAAAPSGAEQVGNVAPVTGADHLRGDKNAPITLIEYSDFQCPFCQRFHPTLVQVMAQYPGKVNWVYRNFPLTSIHPYAQKAAEGAECASEQGKFWEMADKLFATNPEWSSTGLDEAKLATYAGQAGVRDVNAFKTCVSSGKTAARVQADTASGTTAGITGTPGTIIISNKNGSKQLIPGALPFASVQSMIDALLK